MNRRHFLMSSAWLAATPIINRFAFAAAERTDVVVIGAGISGLYTALMLEEKGLSVRVLEASQRAGGRMYTLDELPWKPNTGGTEIGDGYQRLIGLAQKVGVKVIDPPTGEGRGGSTMYVINGQKVLDKDWATSPINQLTESERKIAPPLLETMLLNTKNPLETLDDWYNPKFNVYDVSLADFLKKNGASEEALRLINANANTNDIATTSALNTFKSMTFRTKGGSKKTLRIEGGGQRLPEKVAQLLKRPVEFGQRVIEISDRGGRTDVKCAGGQVYQANKVVVAVPFPAVQKIKIKGRLSPLHYEAIRSLPYTKITQLHVAAKEPFWEYDGMPPTLWTDGAFGRIFVNKGDNGQTGLLAWVNGIEAIALDKIDEKEIIAGFLAEMKQLRPASEGKIEVLKINSWGNNPLAGGAYYHLAPGQASKFFPTLLTPAGNIYFCGEHLGLQNNGMEAACESAEYVVKKITTT
ncbi:MAG: flavin monoamine oxidase family protein [Runella sp.]